MKPQEHLTVSKTETVQPLKQVDFNRDIAPFLPVMIGAYEKANIHAPYSNADLADEVLANEAEEAFEELRNINEMLYDKGGCFSVLDISDLQAIKAYAMSGICELLQVMAVCNKYEQLLEREDNES